MTSPQVQLALRPSRGARAWEVAFPIAFAAVFVLLVRPDGAGQWAVAATVIALLGLQSWRRFRLAAIGTSDGHLVVRNLWRDLTLDRRDIADVVVAPRFTSRAVQLRRQDGSTVWLDVTQTRAALDEQAHQLLAWLHDTGSHPAG